MTFASRHQKGLHQLFLISIWIKGISGILETLAGIVAVFVEPPSVVQVRTNVVFVVMGEVVATPLVLVL